MVPRTRTAALVTGASDCVAVDRSGAATPATEARSCDPVTVPRFLVATGATDEASGLVTADTTGATVPVTWATGLVTVAVAGWGATGRCGCSEALAGGCAAAAVGAWVWSLAGGVSLASGWLWLAGAAAWVAVGVSGCAAAEVAVAVG